MADKTKISWADATWQVTHGCEKIATGCRGCYAIRDVHRMAHNPNPKTSEPRKGLVHKLAPHPDSATKFEPFLDWTGVVRTAPENLSQPLRWKKGRRIFVNSNSDLFHKDVPFEFIAAVWGVMAATPWHRYMVLTKRIDRAREFFKWMVSIEAFDGSAIPPLVWASELAWHTYEVGSTEKDIRVLEDAPKNTSYPLPNVELYVSGATQADVDANVAILLDCPAAFRGLSLEPQVERVDLEQVRDADRFPDLAHFDVLRGRMIHEDDGFQWTKEPNRLDIILQGGESGPNARPFDIAWARYTRDQCRAAGVLYHLKQLGARPRLPYYDENDDREIALSRPHTVYENGEVWSEHWQPDATPGATLIEWKPNHRAGAAPAEWPEDLQGCQDLPGMEVARAD